MEEEEGRGKGRKWGRKKNKVRKGLMYYWSGSRVRFSFQMGIRPHLGQVSTVIAYLLGMILGLFIVA